MNMMTMMRKAKEVQEKMQKIQEEMANLEVMGTAGGGLVSVVLNGTGAMKAVKIDSSLLKSDEIEVLEDLIIAAHNDSKTKITTTMAEKTKSVAETLPIPPELKLPF